ncbi:uncharacterized protein LOC144119815 [Amblyomma americanum]
MFAGAGLNEHEILALLEAVRDVLRPQNPVLLGLSGGIDLSEGTTGDQQVLSCDAAVQGPSGQQTTNTDTDSTEYYTNYMTYVPDAVNEHTFYAAAEVPAEDLGTVVTAAYVLGSPLSFNSTQSDAEDGQTATAAGEEASTHNGHQLQDQPTVNEAAPISSSSHEQQHTTPVSSTRRPSAAAAGQTAALPRSTPRQSRSMQQAGHLEEVIQLNRENVELETASLQAQKRAAETVQATTQTAADAVTKMVHAAKHFLKLNDAAVKTIEKFGCLADALTELTQVQTELPSVHHD